jgi:hypothetical protein
MLNEIEEKYEIWAVQNIGRAFIEIYRGPQEQCLAFIMLMREGENVDECDGTGGVIPLFGNSIEFHRGLSDNWRKMSKLLKNPALKC